MSKSMVERYEQVLSQDPASTVFVELAKALIERGEHARAIDVCQVGLSHHPSSVVGRVLWGKALINLGKPAEAMGQFDHAVSIDKDNPHAYNLIGEVLLHKGLYRSALPILRKAAALQPNDGRIRQWLEQTRAALTGGPAPVLTDSTSVDVQVPVGDDPGATALIETPDNSAMPTVVTQAYSPPVAATNGAPAEPTRSMRTPVESRPSEPADWEVPTQTSRSSSPQAAKQLADTGRSSPTVELPGLAGQPLGAEPEGGVPLGDDPFASVPRRGEPGDEDLVRGLTSTFDALSADNDQPGIPVITGSLEPSDPFAAFPSPTSPGQVPMVKAAAAPPGSEPTVVPSADLLAEAPRRGAGGLLDDVPSELYTDQGEPPEPEQPAEPARAQGRRAEAADPGGRRGLLDDIPDHPEPSSQIEVPRVEVSHTTTEAIAREYERELREKLAVSTAKKTFLQRHGLKLAVALAMLVAVGGGLGAYLYTRSRNQGLDLATAVARARTALNSDTKAQYLSGLELLALGQRMDSDNAEVQALSAFAHAVLYGEHGKAPADLQAATAALAFPGVAENFPELVLVSRLQLADQASVSAARQAVLSSTIEKSEVHAEAGRLLLKDGKPDEALKALTRAVELFPGNVRALVTLGDYYLQFEDYESAAKTFGGQTATLSALHPARVLGLAEARLQLGREQAEALAEVERLTAESGLPPALAGRRELVYGRLLSAAGRHDESLKVLTAAEAQFKDDLFPLLMARGQANRAAGQMEPAQKSFELAVKLAPKEQAEQAKESLGRVLIARSRERELLQRIPREPEARKVSLVRGIAYARLQEWKSARAELQKTQSAKGKYPPEAVVYLSLADASEENADKAIEALKKLVDATKRNKAVVQVALGRVYMQRGDLDKAKVVLEEAAKEPSDYEANALMGELLVGLGLPEVAVDYLARSVDRNGSHGPARHLLGRTLLDLGRHADALKQAEAWVADNASAGGAQKDLAFALFHNGRAKEAEAAIGKAIKLEGDEAEAYRIKAQVLFAKGEPKNAFPALERANKLNPKDGETFCEIGNAFVRQGNNDTAVKAYEAARREDPKAVCGEIGPFHARPLANKVALKDLGEALKKSVHSWDKALAQSSLARVKLLMGDLKGAQSAADEALVLAPFAATAHYAAGAVALRQKDDVKALELMSKAAELDPSWGAALLAHADLLVRQGAESLPKAIAQYEAFLQISQSEGDVARVKNDLKRLKKRL